MKLTKNKNQNAITLITLVITIVVLLILAGVSLSLVVGEDGIVKKAVDASKATDDAQVKETIGMAYQQAIIGQYLNETDLATSMKTDLESTYGTGNVTVTKNDDGTYTVEIEGKGTYDVDATGSIGKQGPSIVVGTMKIVDASGNEITGKIAQGDDTEAYIQFTVSLEDGTDIQVTSSQGTPELKNGAWIMKVTGNGTYSFTVTGKVDGETVSATPSITVAKFSSIPNGLQVGSVVTYYPTGNTYTWMGKYATTATLSGDTTTDDVELSSNVSGNYRITSWKVLEIDEDTDIVKIVPAWQPSTTVKLEGANGYNNAVKLLNDACKTLFVNSSAGITANDVRSINVEDIENAMTTTAVSNAEGEGYPVSMKNASDTYKTTGYTGYKYYPLIYEKETRGIINGNANSGKDLLDESEQNSLIARDADSLKEFKSNGTTPKKGTNGYVNATTSIKPYHTYSNMSLTGSNAKTSAHSTVLCPGFNNYWVASRCVYTDENFCYFIVHGMTNDGLEGRYLFWSYNYASMDYSRAVFPVVSLSSELLESDGGTGFRLISQRSMTE